jgi:hypothetical protein
MGEDFAIKLRAAFKLGKNKFLGIDIVQVLLPSILEEKGDGSPNFNGKG